MTLKGQHNDLLVFIFMLTQTPSYTKNIPIPTHIHRILSSKWFKRELQTSENGWLAVSLLQWINVSLLLL